MTVGQRDAPPLAFAAAPAFHASQEDLSRSQLELFEAIQELRIKLRLYLCFDHGAGYHLNRQDIRKPRTSAVFMISGIVNGQDS